MSDNPFSEPDDADRTVIRPAPGGRRGIGAGSAPMPPPASAPWQDEPSPFGTVSPPTARAPAGVSGAPSPFAAPASPQSAEGAETFTLALNPLIAAAAPLLQLLARLRNTYSQPDSGELRERAVRQMRGFEVEARASGVSPEMIRPAHYALCASLDDVVLNTPWGSSGAWAARSLVSTFHQEVRSGERFFDLLDHLRQNPGMFLPVLELMYLCLSLGFQGRYRLSPRGPGELDRLREDLYVTITRQRGAAREPGLSPRWQGVAVPYRPAHAVVPLWVIGAGALVIIGGLFVWFSAGLNAASDDTFARLLRAPLDHQPAIARAVAVQPPVMPQEAGPERLATFLAPEIKQELVSVLGNRSAPIVRITNSGMFTSGSAAVNPNADALLERIGEALKTEKGPVTVLGYTDNMPIHTVRFPSNYQLSAARAEAARAIVLRTLNEPDRITAQGMGEADPVASNATLQGREANRRIEIVLRRQA